MGGDVHYAILTDVARINIIFAGIEVEPQVCLRARRLCQFNDLFGFGSRARQSRQRQTLHLC